MAEYQFIVLIEADEHGFHAYVPALPGCRSFGKTVEEVQVKIREVMKLRLETMIRDDDE